MGHSGGIGVLCVWSTIGGSRSPGNRTSLWVIRARWVASPAVTCGVSLVFLKRTDVLCIRDKVLLCESSDEYSETVISCSIMTGINA